MCQKLNEAGFTAEIVTEGPNAALSETNICNRGQRRVGVQLELTRGLRNALLRPSNASQLHSFVQAVRLAIDGSWHVTLSAIVTAWGRTEEITHSQGNVCESIA
jgi:hypothetical protein